MIKVFQTEKEYKDYVSDGLNSGEFYFVQENNSAHFRTNNIDDNDIVYDCPKTNVYYEKYLTFEALEDGTFSFGNDIDYSIDNGDTWITLEKNTQSPTVKAGSTIQWKGEITPTGQGVGKFSSTCKFNAYGNVMSLLYGDDFKDKDEITANACFMMLFSQSKIVYAHNLILPSKKIPMVGYYNMFLGCTSLTTAPELPATELGQMCYQGMFQNCSSLTIAPVLPATELGQNSYFGMFQNCSSLTKAPEISATTLNAHSCGNMFMNCTSLTKAPDLLATTLTQGCYSQMFLGCTNLSYIKMLATDVSANNCLGNWVSNVSASGYFVKNENATWNVTGVNGVPSGWTINT